jgi:hypothetical protein
MVTNAHLHLLAAETSLSIAAIRRWYDGAPVHRSSETALERAALKLGIDVTGRMRRTNAAAPMVSEAIETR